MSGGDTPVIELGEWGVPFISITLSFTLTGVVVPVRVHSMGQIKQFNILVMVTINIK